MESARINPFLNIRLRSYVLWALCSIPLLIIAVIFIHSNDDTIWAILGAWFHIVALLWIYTKFRKNHITFQSILGPPPSIWSLPKYISITVLLICFSMSTILFVIYVLTLFLPGVLAFLSQNVISSHPKTSTPFLYLWFNLFFLIVGAPIIEELFFRGIMLHRLATKWGVKRGIILTSIVFAVLHQNENAIGLFMFSVVLCLIYLKTKSLLTTIFCHAVNNTIFSVFFVSDFLSKPTTDTTGSNDLQGVLLAGSVFCIVSLPFLLLIIRKYWRERPLTLATLPYFINSRIQNNS